MLSELYAFITDLTPAARWTGGALLLLAAAVIIPLLLGRRRARRDLAAMSHERAQWREQWQSGQLLLEERTRRGDELQAECAKLRTAQSDLETRCGALGESRANAAETADRLRQELEAGRARLQAQSEQIAQLREQSTRYFSENTALKELRDQDQQRFAAAQRDLETRLKALGEQMLKERGADLMQRSREEFAQAVTPLKEELNVFRALLQTTQKDHSEQTGRLSAELGKLYQAQQTLSNEAQKLAHALTVGGKSQGQWGEQQLERVLNAAGLTKGREYEREVAGLRSAGETGRPDAIVKLPDHRSLVIDAKCSLTAFTEYVNAEDETSRERAMAAHLNSLRTHIDTLSKRDYGAYLSLNAPAFVFMFVPVDGALTAALHADAQLYDRAVAAKIFLVSPSTLLPALRVTANLWMLSTQNERLRTFAAAAQKIFHQYETVVDAFLELQKREQALDASLTKLGSRLKDGPGNLGKRLESFSQQAPQALAAETALPPPAAPGPGFSVLAEDGEPSL